MVCNVKIVKVCAKRIDPWGSTIIEIDTTPVTLIAVGNDYWGGKIDLCIRDDIELEAVIKLMKEVVNNLENMKKEGE